MHGAMKVENRRLIHSEVRVWARESSGVKKCMLKIDSWLLREGGASWRTPASLPFAPLTFPTIQFIRHITIFFNLEKQLVRAFVYANLATQLPA